MRRLKLLLPALLLLFSVQVERLLATHHQQAFDSLPSAITLSAATDEKAHDEVYNAGGPDVVARQRGVADWARIGASMAHAKHRYQYLPSTLDRRNGQHDDDEAQPEHRHKHKPQHKHRKHDHKTVVAPDYGVSAAGDPDKLALPIAVPLTGTFDGAEAVHYHVDVGIGEGKGTYKLLLDTGSAVAWVVGSDCTAPACRGKASGGERKIFDVSASSGGRGRFSITYARGQVSGLILEHTFHFAGRHLGARESSSSPATLSVPHQQFGAADTVSAEEFAENDVDGILGLSPMMQLGVGHPTFLSGLMDTLQPSAHADAASTTTDDERGFISIFLGRPSSGSADRSEIMFGGINPALRRAGSNITFLPNPRSDYWAFHINSFSPSLTRGGPSKPSDGTQQAHSPRRHSKHVDAVKGLLEGGFDVIVDTGTSLIHAPREAVDQFWSSVPGARKHAPPSNKRDGQTDEYWTFPCSSKVGIKLSLGGGAHRQLKVSSRDMNLGAVREGAAECMGALQAMDGSDYFVLGEAGLKSFYVVLDQVGKRVGLAPGI
ncbi:hypothetical protein V8E36_004515 [Tilletia maclaganii]